MNTKRNWNKVAVVVVLALASLSSMAFSASPPALYATALAADVCLEDSVSRVDQYLAAIKWVEQGGPVPEALSVSCVDEDLGLSATFAGYGGESWVRFEQYMAAVESAEQSFAVEPARVSGGSQARFEQYSAAIDWAEHGGPVPEALLTDYGEQALDLSALNTGFGGESWARFEQYLAAIESVE